MKTYRVTLIHQCNDHNSAISITVPAETGALAIDTAKRTNNLAGKVVSARAEELIY